MEYTEEEKNCIRELEDFAMRLDYNINLFKQKDLYSKEEYSHYIIDNNRVLNLFNDISILDICEPIKNYSKRLKVRYLSYLNLYWNNSLLYYMEYFS